MMSYLDALREVWATCIGKVAKMYWRYAERTRLRRETRMIAYYAATEHSTMRGQRSEAWGAGFMAPAIVMSSAALWALMIMLARAVI